MCKIWKIMSGVNYWLNSYLFRPKKLVFRSKIAISHFRRQNGPFSPPLTWSFLDHSRLHVLWVWTSIIWLSGGFGGVAVNIFCLDPFSKHPNRYHTMKNSVKLTFHFPVSSWNWPIFAHNYHQNLLIFYFSYMYLLKSFNSTSKTSIIIYICNRDERLSARWR